MSERARLTIAVIVTTLLLVAVGVAGIAVHAGSPAPVPAARAPVSIFATPPAFPNSTTHWHEEHD